MAETLAEEPSIDPDKLSYEIFSILETNFLFGYDNQKLWLPKQLSPAITDDNNNGTAPAHPIKNQRGKICILTIDGNGMRTILSAKTLSYLETALKSKSNNPAATIADYFDVAAGTGVGGIFTAMLFAGDDLNRPIFNADDTWQLLEKHGKRFQKRRRFCSFRFGQTGLEKVMKEAFTDKTGRSLTLKDTVKPVLIPCYDLASTAPFLFSRADALETDSYDFNLWEVCLATSADTSVFGPVRMRSVDGLTSCVGVDGGLVMSNPTVAAITHVLHNKQEFPHVRGVEDILVLSLGAGGQVVESGFEYEEVKKWRDKDWAKMRARISSDGSAELVDHSVALAYGESRSSNYVRIQANGSSSTLGGAEVDSEEMLKQKNVESVLFSDKRMGEQSNAEKLDWFAEQLVLEHQRRSSRIAPTVAFKQATSLNLSL